MRHVTLRQLRAVAAVAERGTLTRAAQDLRVTPAALTARLHQLEADLGTPLFDRTSEGVRSTEAGALVLAAALRVEEVLTQCAEALDGLRGLGGGRVVVGAVSTAKYFAPQALAGFARLHPKIELRLSVGNRERIVDELRAHTIDLAVMGRPPEGFPVIDAAIGEHPLVVIAPPGHRLLGQGAVPVAMLTAEGFIVREPGSGTRAVFDTLFPGQGAAGLTEMDSNESIKQAVMAGLGVALISAHTIAAEVASGRLAILPVEGLPVLRRWFVVRRADRSLGPAGKAFWAYLEREGAGLLPVVPMPGSASR